MTILVTPSTAAVSLFIARVDICARIGSGYDAFFSRGQCRFAYLQQADDGCP